MGYEPVTEERSVVQFCHDWQISTTTFYRLRERAVREGAAEVLATHSRAPKHPHRVYDEFTIAAVCRIRVELTAQHRENGPSDDLRPRLAGRGIDRGRDPRWPA